MAQPRVPSLGDEWSTSLKSLAVAYGWPEDKMAMAVYAMAEQVHRHYCLSRGIVNHQEPRPDQHVAVSILGSLAGSDWWIAKSMDLRPSVEREGSTGVDDSTEGGL